MTKILTVTEMSRKFADYMNRVRYRGESFVVSKAKEPFAEIKPLPKGLTGAEFLELLRSGPHLDPEDVEQFAKDVNEAREELNKLPIRDPWED